ncbi:MAG: hypothetical protein QM736_19570, partial [Vicinamibacterales bacterium]
MRIEPVASEDNRPQLIGGSLTTLLYTSQLAAISQDPGACARRRTHRIMSRSIPIPADGVPFSHVLDVARWIDQELETLGVLRCRFSGSSGPTPHFAEGRDTGRVRPALRRTRRATPPAESIEGGAVERAVRARGRRVYVDYLQNIQGKTLASVYSARASVHAGALRTTTGAVRILSCFPMAAHASNSRQ